MKLPFRGHRTARCAVLPRRACDVLLQCAERRVADAAHRQGDRMQARHGRKC